ncbi:MAG: hypothetical protein GPJ54_00140 [Candidatus Heimdallarchaeota archaeon]|nr:hypothetical protein [Candidatus Heimdallarchaeota archaeon]
MSLKIGLLINPIAGVGAALAWKGTDNIEKAWIEVEKGGNQPVWDICRRALSSIKKKDNHQWILGGNFSDLVIGTQIYELPNRSKAEHTKIVAKKMLENKVQLILFVGGDGTAKDIAEIVSDIPILGIPGGVKIFSPCFLHKPEDLGELLEKWDGEVKEVDILDLDESEYIKGNPISTLVGSALIPLSTFIQAGKNSFTSDDDNQTYELIASRIEEERWLESTTIIVGPGSTMKQIFSHLNLQISLLGVDVIQNGKIVKLDCTETEIDKFKIDQIWITPIGSQGHIFGRGNKQISTSLLKKLQKSDIKIFSTPLKLLETRQFYLDTGSMKLDSKYKGFYHVISGYHEEVMRKAI